MATPEPVGRPFEVSAHSLKAATEAANTALHDQEIIVFAECVAQPQVGIGVAWGESEVAALQFARELAPSEQFIQSHSFTPLAQLEFTIEAENDELARLEAAQRLPGHIYLNAAMWYGSEKSGTLRKSDEVLRRASGKVLAIAVENRGSRGFLGLGKRKRTYKVTCGHRCEISVNAPGRWLFEAMIPRERTAIRTDIEMLAGYLQKTASGAEEHLARNASDMEKVLALSTIFQLFDNVYTKKLNALIAETKVVLPDHPGIADIHLLEFKSPKRFDASDAPVGIKLILDAGRRSEALLAVTSV